MWSVVVFGVGLLQDVDRFFESGLIDLGDLVGGGLF